MTWFCKSQIPQDQYRLVAVAEVVSIWDAPLGCVLVVSRFAHDGLSGGVNISGISFRS
ncbi:MAG: hypothetical protein K8F91_19365 [Candidatus Obscuribacterales bacterium]|nr:hypothetical protein [Candidatus Obscuribacterales bacterium]